MKAKRILSLALAAALVLSSLVIVPDEAGAAKKVSLSKKSATLKVGGSVKIKVKNGNKKAKVTWKVSDKAVLKIAKKSTKGNKAYATVKGLAAGTAKLTASYKLARKTKKYSCKIVVSDDSANQGTNTGTTTTAPTGTTAPNGTATKAPEGSAAPTAAATDKPATATRTPRPSATPSPTPVPDPDLEIAKNYATIDIDGTVEAAWDFVDFVDVDKWAAESGGTARQTTNAKAKFLWDDSNVYVLVTADDGSVDVSGSDDAKKDSVELYFDQYNTKVDYEKGKVLRYRQVIEEGKAGAAVADSSKWDGAAIKSAVKRTGSGYAVEFAIPLDKDKGAKEGNFCGIEIQINDCTGGSRNGIITLFSTPDSPAADNSPSKSATVFGDCKYMVKRVTKVITLDLKDDSLRNMEKPAQFVGNESYDTMNTECSFDDVNGKIICKTANNVFLIFPEGRQVLNTEKAKVQIKGTYSGENGFRVWMCDTRSGVSDDAATSSNQVTFLPDDITAATDGEGKFTIEAELTSEPTTSASWSEKFPDTPHDGNSNALMIKASSWNGMLEDLVIESVVVTVEDPILNTP